MSTLATFLGRASAVLFGVLGMVAVIFAAAIGHHLFDEWSNLTLGMTAFGVGTVVLDLAAVWVFCGMASWSWRGWP